MKTYILIVTLIATLSIALAGNAAIKEGVALTEAVADFNKKSLSDAIGANQTPLTVDEVVAAILLWERPADAPVSDDLLASFKGIAETKTLPSNARFESLTGYDRGGSHIFDVWSVRIRMDRADGSSYAFVLRERVVRSRTLHEELARLAKFIDEKDVEKRVGGYRILERKKELETRIKKGAQQ